MTARAAALFALFGLLGGCEVLISDHPTKGGGGPTPGIDGGPGRDGGGDCPIGQTRCGERCVDLTSDPAACGFCSIACAGVECVEGECDGLECPELESYCDMDCVDTSTSPEHCGGCFNSCDGGGACRDGECVPGGAAYAFRHYSAPTRGIPPIGECMGEPEVGVISAVNVNPPHIYGSSVEVHYLNLTFSLEPAGAEVNRLAQIGWGGSGELWQVRVVAAVVGLDGAQFVLGDGQRVYTTWPEAVILDNGEGFRPGEHAITRWENTFVTVHEDGTVNEFVPAEEAQLIFDACFNLTDLQVLEINTESPLTEPP